MHLSPSSGEGAVPPMPGRFALVTGRSRGIAAPPSVVRWRGPGHGWRVAVDHHRRAGAAERVAAITAKSGTALAFPASHEAAFNSGPTLNVDGGWAMHQGRVSVQDGCARPGRGGGGIGAPGP